MAAQIAYNVHYQTIFAHKNNTLYDEIVVSVHIVKYLYLELQRLVHMYTRSTVSDEIVI